MPPASANGGLLHSRIVAKFEGRATPVGDFGPSEFVNTAASPIQDFALSGHKQENVHDEFGHGRRLSITGVSGGLRKTVVVTVYDEIPRMAFCTTGTNRMTRCA